MDDTLLLEAPIANRTVSAGMAAAVAAGTLVALAPGRWQWSPEPTATSVWIRVSHDASRHCRFYSEVMFRHVYQESLVPAGCAACFKVKVSPRSLRELVALREMAKTLPYTHKCGLDANTVVTQGLYGGYFYLNSLDAARAAFRQIRQAVDADSKLGPQVSVAIKRGCTHYELKCGPSDQYRFLPEQAGIEAALRSRIEPAPKLPSPSQSAQKMQTFLLWIETAYRLGDETYRDFTGGKRLFSETVKYDPEGQDAPAGANGWARS